MNDDILSNAKSRATFPHMGNATDRILRLVALAELTGLTLDYLEALIRGCDDSYLAKLCGNASRLPNTMKSIENPYVSRKATQLSSDGL